MSDGELHMGTALFLRSFKDHPNENVVLSFGGPKEKGRYHLAIWLGTWAEGEKSASERLNEMGWVFDPTKAAQAIEAGTAKTEGLGPKDESAVHAPKPNQEPTNG